MEILHPCYPSFKVDLIYHIEKEELFALKKTYLTSNIENEKLTENEISTLRSLLSKDSKKGD